MSARSLSGIIPAVPTPVDADGQPDTTRFLAHARWVLDKGCHGINVLGTTGEANSLSAGQRKTVMEAAATLEAPLMVGTGTPDLATTMDLTRHAHELGYAGALVLPPWYYKQITDDGLFEWYACLIAATAQTPIAIYFYNFPQLTGLSLSFDLMQRLKNAFPNRIAGIKDSAGDFTFTETLLEIADFDVFPGNEIGLVESGPGYAGCISATVNATAPLAVRFWDSSDNADLRQRIVGTRSAIAAHPAVPAVKYLVGKALGDTEFERVLPPNMPLSDEQKVALDSITLD